MEANLNILEDRKNLKAIKLNNNQLKDEIAKYFIDLSKIEEISIDQLSKDCR